MEENKIIVARKRVGEYVVNYLDNAGNMRQYKWLGSVGNRTDTKPVPETVVLWLTQFTSCFKDGELVLTDETNEFTKQIKEEIPDIKNIETQLRSREEVEKLLKGNYKTLSKELKDISIKGEQDFILQVAKELSKKGEFDSVQKRGIIAELFDTEADILFENEEE